VPVSGRVALADFADVAHGSWPENSASFHLVTV
jgi:hypothetical protein